jgi:hypothetical protein
MFDSPFDHCPVCNQMVLLDQTQRECALEHGCLSKDRCLEHCPLARQFCGHDFSAAPPTRNVHGSIKKPS